jgi:hypothetical protein
MMDVVQAMRDPNLLNVFGNPKEWLAWTSVLKGTYGLALDPDELALFKTVAGGREPPSSPVKELCAVIGRRGGKTRVASALLVWSAVSRNWREVCAPGEVATHVLLAGSKEQAAIALRYCKAMLEVSPVMRQHVVNETADGVLLDTNAELVILASNFRSIRGRSVPLCIMDEVSFWHDGLVADLPNETYAALRPSMATFPNPLLVLISSAYKKSGLFFERYEAGYGKNDPDQLVVLGASRVFNPTLSEAFVAKELRRDPTKNSAEYLSQWRLDIEKFISLDALRECVVPHRRALAPSLSIRYRAFVDVSGGANDSLALCIAHDEGEVTVVDLVHERESPFDPQAAVRETVEIMRRYRVQSVTGDNYAAGWASGAFEASGIKYTKTDLSKSRLYENLLPSIMSKRIELLDHPETIAQIYGLERRTARGGRDTVDHSRGAHDDLANVIAGICHDNLGPSTRTVVRSFDGEITYSDSEDSPVEALERERRNAVLCGEQPRMRTVYEGNPHPDLFKRLHRV